MKKQHLLLSICIAFSMHIQSALYSSAYDDIIKKWQATLDEEPSNLNAHFHLGHAYLAIGKLTEALDAYRTILAHYGSYLTILHSYAHVFEMLNDFDSAIAIYKHLIKIKPDYAQPRFGLAFSLLKKGDFKNAWKAHYWNLSYQKKHAPEFHHFLKTNSLSGKDILLIPEGGLGDTINFIRYTKRVKQLGAHVIAAVQKPLINLFSRCTYIDQLKPIEDVHDMPHHGLATYITLPALFEDEEDAFTDEMPYVFPDPELVELWKDRIKNDPNFKIGISWQSNARNDSVLLPLNRRGIPLEDFMLLADIPHVTFYSLQKHDGLDQIGANAFPLKVFDQFDDENGAFMDTAALMESMDLIIAVDSAVAHLAGAMGKKVWTLLPFSADWRWICGRTTSPWYPTMRLFRQHQPLDWLSALQDVRDELIKEIDKSKGCS